MSTKAYHGVLFRHQSVDAILSGVDGLMDEIEALQRKQYHKVFGERFMDHLDQQSMIARRPGKNNVANAMIATRTDIENGTDRCMTSTTIGLSIYQVPGTSRFLGHWTGACAPSVVEVLTETSKAIAFDYVYWNNTDPDPGVPSRRWEERARDWDAVSEPIHTLAILFDSADPYPQWNEIAQHIQTTDARAKKHATSIVADLWAARQEAQGLRFSVPALLDALKTPALLVEINEQAYELLSTRCLMSKSEIREEYQRHADCERLLVSEASRSAALPKG